METMESLRNLWNNIKRGNIQVIVILEAKERIGHKII